MISNIFEIFVGVFIGLLLGATGLAPLGLVLIILDYLKIGDYKTNVGTILFLNLFPLTIGSVFQFWNAKKINFTMGLFLLFGIIIGSLIGSYLVVRKEHSLSIKTLKYISAFIGLIMAILFFYSAYYEKN
jgi:uncharacterized membrane protein YfcA